MDETENENQDHESKLAEPPEGFWEALEPEEPSPEARAREAVQEQLQEAGHKRRALLNVNVTRTKGIVAELSLLTSQVTRLALAVENLLEQAYGFRSQPGEMSGEEPGVDYTDQDKYDISEALEQAKNLEREGDHD